MELLNKTKEFLKVHQIHSVLIETEKDLYEVFTRLEAYLKALKELKDTGVIDEIEYDDNVDTITDQIKNLLLVDKQLAA
jgi:hypothetical protein